jgi:uncharacterized membrane protein YkvA (DUF1232 family)
VHRRQRGARREMFDRTRHGLIAVVPAIRRPEEFSEKNVKLHPKCGLDQASMPLFACGFGPLRTNFSRGGWSWLETFRPPRWAWKAIMLDRLLDRLKEHARQLERELLALYLAARDPRTPWYARVTAAAVVAYALSPFDLIPDFIPVVGYLDDLIIVPAGIALVLRMVPAAVLADCRERASQRVGRPMSRIGAAFMIAVWLGVGTWVVVFAINRLMH